MAQLPAIIPPEVERLKEEREALWRQFDATLAQARQIETLAGGLPAPAGAPEPLPALAGGDNPALEISAAAGQLETALRSLRQTEADIARHESAIEQIKAQRVKYSIAAAALFIIVLLILL